VAKSPGEVDEATLAKIRADIARWYPGIWSSHGPVCHCGLKWETLTNNAKVPTVQCKPMRCPRHEQRD
jgi:hypothetical protein